ncbi:MAG: DUF6285 domain-containing protein [Pseudomonadota bacterium]|nr:hypothetical protein [Desulfobacteraceae bacterium]
MQDHPSTKELIKGIHNFLENDVVPALQEPLRFHTRVAANLLKIIERELDLEADHLSSEIRGLWRLLSKAPDSIDSSEEMRAQIRKMNEELCELIRTGKADNGPWANLVMDHVKRSLVQKLEIANPDMIAKAQAKY